MFPWSLGEKGIEGLEYVLKHGRVERIVDELAAPLRDDEVGALEDVEVMAQSRSREIKMFLDIGDAHGALFEELEDAPTAGVRHCLERRIHNIDI